jgi:AcrR family transcriptional regulator
MGGVPRIPQEDRLHAIATAATEVFGRQGYRRTRMADVATEAGVSSGSVFTYVESKEALFQLVFQDGFGVFDGLPSLPLPTPESGETVELIRQHLRKVAAPMLREALHEERPTDIRDELRAIVVERYDMLWRLWPLLAVIERCAIDLPELESFYFGDLRLRYFAQLTRYVEARAAQGYFRPLDDAALTARFITESITWFAWKRHEGRDAHLYDEDAVRRTVVEFIDASLVDHR